MRKTALLTGVAGLFLMTAPAFAQDSTAPQTPPAPSAQEPAGEQAAPAPTQSLTLQPGSDVKGSDGAVLGKLEGARNTEAGQELTVRGADGELRGIPVSGGVRQDGAGVAVGWTSAQFAAATAIDDAATPVDEPAAESDEAAEPAEPAEPATPAVPATPANPGVTPATPAVPATPAAPANPDHSGHTGATPAPGEGQTTPDKPGA
ncbi:superoxide dismutase [Brevundimonas sp.]|uniref:superoxide dismutase n=1 Tax=Brevundimonas sp. TaxID=1871086 RepID=UPI002FC5C59B